MNKQFDYYKFLKIIDNKCVCVINNLKPKRYCLNGYNITLWFELLNGEYSEWSIEKISDNRIINSILNIKKYKICRIWTY